MSTPTGPTAAQAAEDYDEPWQVYIPPAYASLSLHRPNRPCLLDSDGDCGGFTALKDAETLGRVAAAMNACAGVPTANLPPAGVLAALLEALEARRRHREREETISYLAAAGGGPEHDLHWDLLHMDAMALRAALDRALSLADAAKEEA